MPIAIMAKYSCVYHLFLYTEQCDEHELKFEFILAKFSFYLFIIQLNKLFDRITYLVVERLVAIEPDILDL
jgi:hypothetical protein